MLKRHVATGNGLSVDQYRARSNLPREHPITAPGYSERRSSLAKQIGLGRGRRRRASGEEPESVTAENRPAPQPRTRRLPAFATNHWACSRADIDWKAEGIRSSTLEFVAYALGFFHDGHRAASDCRAALHMLAQPLPKTGRLALQALLEKARPQTWRLWARDSAIETKDLLKNRGYTWSPESSSD
jgi:ROS/MUCR transcriptional regulator protein